MSGEDEPSTPSLNSVIEKIRRQTMLLRSIIDSLGDGLIVADENGKFLIFNPEAERILGLGAIADSPEKWSERYGVFLPDGVTPFPAEQLPLMRAIRGEETNRVELVVRNPNVPVGVRIAVTGRPLRDEDGSLRGGVVVFRELGP